MSSLSSVRFSDSEVVDAVAVDLGDGGVEGDRDLLARHAAGALDGLDEQLHRFLVRREVGREAALVADRRRQAHARAAAP